MRASRPRCGEIDTAVLSAVVELLAERGVDGTTMSAIIERSGASIGLATESSARRGTLAVKHSLTQAVAAGCK